LALTFEHRRAAYVAYYTLMQQTTMRIHDHGFGISPGRRGRKLPWNWSMELLDARRHLELYASEEVSAAAARAFREVVHEWGDHTRYGQRDEAFLQRMRNAMTAVTELMESFRVDLKVPDATRKVRHAS
jgi:hypothetical protein